MPNLTLTVQGRLITLTVQNREIVLETGRGKSAYQSYRDTTDDDPPLSEASWVDSLKGEAGEPGEPGEAGPPGTNATPIVSIEDDGDGNLTIETEDDTFGPFALKGATGKSAYQSYLDTTTDDPVLTEEEWSQGGGGGGDYLPLAGGVMDTGAEIAFDNYARIRQTPNDYGLDQVCSVDYVHRWKNGSLYILDQSEGIRSVQYGLTSPTEYFDSSQGYLVGCRFTLDDGTVFECTDNTEGAAVWVDVTPVEPDDSRLSDARTPTAHTHSGDTLGALEKLTFDTTPAGTLSAAGEMQWNPDFETIDVQLNGFILHTGQHVVYHVKNSTASTIAKGVPVMFAGTTGNSGKLNIKPWDGIGPATYFMGLTAESLTTGSEGFVIAFGKLTGIQTNGGNYSESWVDGEIIYAGASAGTLTKTAPAFTSPFVQVLAVVHAHASNGIIFVRPNYYQQHSHGNLTNAGAIGSTSGLPIKTGTSGILEAGAFGSSAGQFAEGNHTHSNATTGSAGFLSASDKSKLDGIASGAEVNVNADWNAESGDSQILNKPTLGGAAALNVGTTAGTVAAGDHSHAQLHDAVTVSDSSSIDLTLTGQQISASAIFGTTSGTVCQGDDSRLSDARTPISHSHAISDVTSLQTTLDGKAAASHSHGNISNSGAIGTTANRPVKTGTSGLLEAGSAMLGSLGLVIDGAGSAITTGVKGYLRVPYSCTINSVEIVADQSGSIVIDIWRDTYANFPPTVSDTIVASAKPTLSSAQKNQDTTLTGWATLLPEGDYLAFNVDSSATVTRVALTIKVTRTL